MRSLHYKLWVTLLLSLLGAAGLWAASEPQKPLDRDLEVRERMVVISRQLGVTCAYCHDLAHLKSNEKPPFKIALAHIKMVERLNAQHVSGLPKVDCYMCHRGNAKPEFREPLAEQLKSGKQE